MSSKTQTVRKIDFLSPRALYGVTATRSIELQTQSLLPPHTLMQRAGLALARLALSIAPHARLIWIACGPGNNGGDGMEAAMHLQHWGKRVLVTWLGDPDHAPSDAAFSFKNAQNAGVEFAQSPPQNFDLCIDALLGIGGRDSAPVGQMANWIELMNANTAPVLAVDIPTGLNANTGVMSQVCVKATDTLSLLTLKPGLFMGQGRDAAGTVWFDDLGAAPWTPDAWLAGLTPVSARLHASHKGSYGDVAVVGGAPAMTGGALLAARAALHSGAGRVFVSLLDSSLTVDVTQPELMFRAFDALNIEAMTLVCGCGGGELIAQHMPQLLASSSPLVIDADAINSIANDAALQTLLIARGTCDGATVITPHPLEAARLLACSVMQIQTNRMASAAQLAQRYACTVVLKGSGTIIAEAGNIPVVNPTGNAKLATAGTGDVLAGMIGAHLAMGLSPFDAACQAVYQHGSIADHWARTQTLTASQMYS